MTGERPVIVITGGSRGIGAATARLAAERGYRVAVVYRVNRAAADKVLRDIQSAGSNGVAVEADVAAEADVVRLFETVDARLGRVDVLVNNAGILDRQTTVADMSAERILRTLSVNVLGPFLCAREAVRRMATSRGRAHLHRTPRLWRRTRPRRSGQGRGPHETRRTAGGSRAGHPVAGVGRSLVLHRDVPRRLRRTLVG